MAQKDKFLLSVGLAKKAGALFSGQNAVLESLRKNEAGLVFLASDISAPTRKKLTSSCAYYKVPLRESGHTMGELSEAIGKLGETAAISVRRSSFLHLFETAKH